MRFEFVWIYSKYDFGLIVSLWVYFSRPLPRKDTKRGSRKEPFLRKGFLTYLPKGDGVFALSMRENAYPSRHIGIPLFLGARRTKTGGFVRLGVPSVELLGHCVTKTVKSVTDKRDIAESVRSEFKHLPQDHRCRWQALPFQRNNIPRAGNAGKVNKMSPVAVVRRAPNGCGGQAY